MWFRVDSRSSSPVYQQVIDGIKQSLAKAIVRPLGQVTLRTSLCQHASTMMLNPNTAAKAYQELERMGIIEVIRGRGTYVAQPTSPVNRDEGLSQLHQDIKKLFIDAHYLQLDDRHLLDMFHLAMNQWQEEKGHPVL